MSVPDENLNRGWFASPFLSPKPSTVGSKPLFSPNLLWVFIERLLVCSVFAATAFFLKQPFGKLWCWILGLSKKSIPFWQAVLRRWSQGLGLLVRRKIMGQFPQVFHSYGWHSENSGKHPPKSSTLMGFSMIFTIHFGGPPLFLETPIYPGLKRAMRLGSFQKLGNHQSTVNGKGWKMPICLGSPVDEPSANWNPLCFVVVFFSSFALRFISMPFLPFVMLGE